MSTKKTQPGAARTQTYRAAFDQLTRIAAELEEGETDLDRVLPLLAEAQAAYDICRGRIEALRMALGQEGMPGDVLLAVADAEDEGDDDGEDASSSDASSSKDELDDFF